MHWSSSQGSLVMSASVQASGSHVADWGRRGPGMSCRYSEECRRAFYVEWRRRARDDAATATTARARENVGAVQQLLLLCVHAHHRFVGNAAISEVRRAFGDPPTSESPSACYRVRSPLRCLHAY
jgi:hypothetical protein